MAAAAMMANPAPDHGKRVAARYGGRECPLALHTWIVGRCLKVRASKTVIAHPRVVNTAAMRHVRPSKQGEARREACVRDEIADGRGRPVRDFVA